MVHRLIGIETTFGAIHCLALRRREMIGQKHIEVLTNPDLGLGPEERFMGFKASCAGGC